MSDVLEREIISDKFSDEMLISLPLEPRPSTRENLSALPVYHPALKVFLVYKYAGSFPVFAKGAMRYSYIFAGVRIKE
jgi:hypothetical protein